MTAATPVSASQRFSRRRPCQICGGGQDMPRGEGCRDWGFLSADARFAHCSRTEFANGIEQGADGAYAHFLAGPCRCGRDHRQGFASFQDRPYANAKVAKPAKVPDRGESAVALWRAARPAQGTIVERYLRSRAISLPIPITLRFAPSLRHTPSGRLLPAMVAAITIWPAFEPGAVHRTFLRPDGSGKAKVTPCRMMLGPSRGGAVRLAAPGPTLALAEGIETALSFQLATGTPTWASLSASGIEGLVLPPPPLATEVIIAADGDPVGLRAAYAAAERFTAEGRRVRIARPPEGLDFNDLLREGVA